MLRFATGWIGATASVAALAPIQDTNSSMIGVMVIASVVVLAMLLAVRGAILMIRRLI